MRCLECGKIMGDIRAHIVKHKMTWQEYEAKHGKGTVGGRFIIPPRIEDKPEVGNSYVHSKRKRIR